LQSAELLQVLKQKPPGLPADNMKRHAALLKPSEFDWSEAKLSGYGRDGCAGIGVIARQEHGLSMPIRGGIRSELCSRQMIKSLYESCSGECLGQDLRREGTAQLFRSNMKRIGRIDDDLSLPLLELLRDILVGGKWNSEKNDFGGRTDSSGLDLSLTNKGMLIATCLVRVCSRAVTPLPSRDRGRQAILGGANWRVPRWHRAAPGGYRTDGWVQHRSAAQLPAG
jgi:hypothetical protein